jgi:amino acid permease
MAAFYPRPAPWQPGRLVNRTLGKFLGWIFSTLVYVADTGGGLSLISGGGKTHEGVLS